MRTLFNFCQKISKSISVLILQNKVETLEKDLLEVTQEIAKLREEIKELYENFKTVREPVVKEEDKKEEPLSKWVK